MRLKFMMTSILLLAACSGYKTPGLSGDPSKMSADTLCYRYAYGKSNRALKDEIDARGLECGEILREQPHSGQDPSRAVGNSVGW
ncbi:MAG: hypothetical protein DYH13_09900 [Alphaproteobacteria bacterium PRO2]|nr:hypothetical protein [Alphaproteobacteria bacterium PRO2]